MSDNAPPPPGSGDPNTPPPGSGDAPPPPPPPGSGGHPPPPPPPGGGWGAAPPPPPGAGYGGGPGGPAGYSVGNAFNYAIKKFQENLLPLVLITLILIVAVGIIQGIGYGISNAVAPDPTFNFETGKLEGGGGFFGISMIVSLLFSAISWATQLIVQSGIIRLSLGLTRGEKLDVGRAFQGINWAQVVVASLLIGVGTFVGLLLCIIPGIIFIFLTWFTLYFVLDRNMDAVSSIRASIDLVRNNVATLLVFFLASVAAYIIGACLCGIGLLAAIPIVVIAQAYTFRTLTGDTVTA